MNHINPYAPSATSDAKPIRIDRPPAAISTFSITLRALTGIIAAGGAFGLAICLWDLVDETTLRTTRSIEIVPVAIGLGAVLAGFAGLFTVGISGTLLAIVGLPACWSPTLIRVYAVITGGISGFITIAIPAGFDGRASTFALLPAGFGIAGALITTITPAKQAKYWQMNKDQAPISPGD